MTWMELAETLCKPFEKLREKTVVYDANEFVDKALEVIGRMLEDDILNLATFDYHLQKAEVTARKRRESDREAKSSWRRYG